MKPGKNSELDRPYIAHDETNAPLFAIETVMRAQSGDKKAFAVLYKSTYPQMHRVVRDILEHSGDIEDALQIGYIKAYKYISRLKEPAAFYGWLKRTMENAARDVQADSWSHDDLDEYRDELEAILAEDNTEDNDLKVDIRSVIDRMAPEYWQLLVLHYYEGRRLSEIARQLDEPPSTVRSRFAKAKQELLRRLKDKGITRTIYGGVILLFFVALKQSIKRQWVRPAVRTATVTASLAAAGTVMAAAVLANLPKTVPLPESDIRGDYTNGMPTGSSSGNSAATLPSTTASNEQGEPSSPSSQPPVTPDDFVPDYRPGMANTATRGQSSRFSGKEHFVRVDRQDEWLYIYNRGESVDTPSYKMRFDGSEKVTLPLTYSQGANAVVMGDWIYYSGGRMRTDGTGEENPYDYTGWFEMTADTMVYTSRPGPTIMTTAYAYDLTTGKTRKIYQGDQPNPHFILFREYMIFPYSGTVVSITDGKAYEIDGLCVPGSDYQYGFGAVGDRLYLENSINRLRYLDFSGDMPVLYDKELVDPVSGYGWYEFIDTAGQRLAVSDRVAEGVYHSYWYSLDGELLGERPEHLRRTGEYQSFQYFEDGWVFVSNADDKTLYRCRTDGSGYWKFIT